MKRGAAVALGVVAAGAALALVAAYAGGSHGGSLPPPSPGLRPPMAANRRYMVTFTMPRTLTELEARALLNFVAAWGTLEAVQFAPDRAGNPTAVVTARTLRELPGGIA